MASDVLVVDDEADIRELVAGYIGPGAFAFHCGEVDLCGNGVLPCIGYYLKHRSNSLLVMRFFANPGSNARAMPSDSS